jgi:hypothetical protein
MRNLMVLIGLPFLAALMLGGVLAGSSDGSSASPAGATVTRTQEIVEHGEDLFSSVALWEAETLYELVTQAPSSLQAAFGVLLCLRSILALIGLYVVLTLRRMATRVSHRVNGD